MESEKLERLLEESIVATDRTTHAVRAFVRFLFIQLSAVSLAAVFYFWALAVDPLEPPWSLLLFATLIWVVGIILSSRAGWGELAKSDVPSRTKDSTGGFFATGRVVAKTQDQTKLDRLTRHHMLLWREAGRPSLESWDPNEDVFDDWIAMQ
jgi:hypothetical protein